MWAEDVTDWALAVIAVCIAALTITGSACGIAAMVAYVLQ